jgi:hypothetical protein
VAARIQLVRPDTVCEDGMTDTHRKLLRALIAAQVAVLEHADENIATSVSPARLALLKCLLEATKLGKALD